MTGFVPPPYPYDRLSHVVALAEASPLGKVDCSIGTPTDPPPQSVIDILGSSGLERGYPTSAGSIVLRDAVVRYLERRFGVDVGVDQVAACVGTKEFVASTAHLLHLRDPSRDVVLYPAISYPTYAMGATLAGLVPVAVPVTSDGHLDLDSIDPALRRRTQLLWTNSPSNPTGALDDLEAAAHWGRLHNVPVFSDECYAEFTWQGPPRSILETGLDGVVAVHSISKRSNLAGLRCGFYAGDDEIVSFLRGVRQHAGLMVPGPVQAAVGAAYDDDAHVEVQRGRYLGRLQRLAEALSAAGIAAQVPDGTFYLWVEVPQGFDDGWALAAHLAERCGLVVSPGDLYGEAGARYVRIAVVVSDEDIAQVASLLEG